MENTKITLKEFVERMKRAAEQKHLTEEERKAKNQEAIKRLIERAKAHRAEMEAQAEKAEK